MISNFANLMLDEWKAIANIDTGRTSFGGESWEAHKRFVTASEALTFDPSGIATGMLAEGFLNDHLASCKYSIADIMAPSDHILWLLSRTKILQDLLAHEETKSAFEGFRGSVTKALEHYEVALEGRYPELLKDNESLASLRLSALRSVKELQLDQFLRGTPEGPDAKPPIFMKVIHKWWNINSLLAAATRMPSGVALHMIGTPKAMDCYFVFVIRNGGNLYILSDVAKESHPLQSGMRRRPERHFASRVDKNWFPYELADVAFNEEEEMFYETKSKARDLVAYQTEWRTLSPINTLEPEATIWLSMMFSLIIQRFWGEDVQAEELSYTGEMLIKSQVLLDKATHANLPVVANKALQAVTIDHASISQKNATKEEIGESYELTHSWMEDRYGHKVSQDVLNLTSSPDEQATLSLNTSGRVVVMDDSLEKDRTSVRVQVANAYPSTRFATARQLENDRKFLARCNYADAIQMMAKREFEQRENEIKQWFQKCVRSNLKTLLSFAGNEAIWIKDGIDTGRERTTMDNRSACRSNKQGHQFHRFMGMVNYGDENSWWGSTRLYQFSGNTGLCNITGAKASYLVGFTPANAKELAIVAGCEVSELPDVLQHWDIRHTQTGNSILGRIDPMAWRVEDPWSKMNFTVTLVLSKRGMAQVKKAIEHPPLDIATEEEMAFSSGVIGIKLGGFG